LQFVQSDASRLHSSALLEVTRSLDDGDFMTFLLPGEHLDGTPASPQDITLDLLRSYAHDCLHHGTFRRYQLTLDRQATRIQYGINFRRPDGLTYSAPDPPDATCTRNLGIIMEGATDTEATTITRATTRQPVSPVSADPPTSPSMHSRT
jgi:hypothetical protein